MHMHNGVILFGIKITVSGWASGGRQFQGAIRFLSQQLGFLSQKLPIHISSAVLCGDNLLNLLDNLPLRSVAKGQLRNVIRKSYNASGGRRDATSSCFV